MSGSDASILVLFSLSGVVCTVNASVANCTRAGRCLISLLKGPGDVPHSTMMILVRLWISAYTLRRHLGQRKPLRDHSGFGGCTVSSSGHVRGHKEHLAALELVQKDRQTETVELAVSV